MVLSRRRMLFGLVVAPVRMVMRGGAMVLSGGLMVARRVEMMFRRRMVVDCAICISVHFNGLNRDRMGPCGAVRARISDQGLADLDLGTRFLRFRVTFVFFQQLR